ncbi:MAG: putative porin [Thermodesulfobacteriota bacterium]
MTRIGKRLGVFVLIGLLSVLGAGGGTAAAGDNAELNGIEALIGILKEKKIMSEEEAAAVLGRLQEQGQKTEEKKVITIMPRGQMYLKQLSDTVAADIKDEVKEQVKYEIKDEVVREIKLGENTGPVPSWTKRIRWGGDIRIRQQSDLFDEKNDPAPDLEDATKFINTTVDRHRQRIRLRLVAQAEVNDQVEVGVRLATGNEKDPVSTNETLGDYKNKDGIVLDQAFVRWTVVPEASLWGGRMPNPFFSSDLVWDGDLNFEGIALTGETPLTGRWRSFINLGAFPLQEIDKSSNDKWLYGAQAGIHYEPRPDIHWKLATSYYDFNNITGIANTPANPNLYDHTLPLFKQRGNTLYSINPFNRFVDLALASDYTLVNLTTSLDFGLFHPVTISLLADYVKNIGFDQSEIFARTGELVPGEDEGYHFSLAVGYPSVRKFMEWKTYIAYKRLEADAVVDAFTDSDFHLGGSNAKGWILGGDLGLYDNIWLSAKWISSDEIIDEHFAVDTLQIDLNSRF